jgi:hypothetical protein
MELENEFSSPGLPEFSVQDHIPHPRQYQSLPHSLSLLKLDGIYFSILEFLNPI